MDKTTPLLETKSLTKKFGGLTAVNNVNLVINNTERRIGIMGPNGAGKTTLINLITGLLKPTSGKIFFRGEDITNMGIHDRAAKLGIVRTFQLASVFNSLNCIENLALIRTRFRRKKKILWKFLGNIYDDIFEEMLWLERFNLKEKAFQQVSDLPYGEKRKLEIAMALSLEPKILFLDEPFAGLNDAEIEEICQLIEKFTGNITVVIIEHKISKIIPFVDRLCVLHEGKLIADGKPDVVENDPYVKKVYWKY